MEEKEEESSSCVADNNTSPPESLPFVTTSQVLNQLNKNLQELQAPGEEEHYLEPPRFELQKRLPDGSTIPASESDLSASDLQTKLQQSAKFVSQLRPEDKRKWANQQRLSGNVLFERGEYKAAMDIYLTCLVVKETGGSKEESVEFLSKTLLPVLNNLAQCTLQLGMQKKTMEFCNIALEEISKVDEDHGDDPYSSLFDPIAICRIYFKRGKARRLTGDYFEARQDLNRSVEFLEKKKKEEEDTTDPYHQAIQKEFRHLEMAEREARKNKQRQKRAMQKALAAKKDVSKTGQEKAAATAKASLSSKVAVTDDRPRQYSTLRAKKKAVPIEEKEQEKGTNTSLSYWQYYWLVVARVAEGLLMYVGDEETKASLQEQDKEKST